MFKSERTKGRRDPWYQRFLNSPISREGNRVTKLFAFNAFVLVVAGCAPIEHMVTTSQALNRSLIAGPGGVVVHADKERNLQNAFGRSDVFGRKTAEGYVELYFSGVENDGTIVLYRTGAEIISNETTTEPNADLSILRVSEWECLVLRQWCDVQRFRDKHDHKPRFRLSCRRSARSTCDPPSPRDESRSF
jgi:hypothetical protein